jgi:hypothetical protein
VKYNILNIRENSEIRLKNPETRVSLKVLSEKIKISILKILRLPIIRIGDRPGTGSITFIFLTYGTYGSEGTVRYRFVLEG